MFLKKIAAEKFPKPPAVVVREYDELHDKMAVEELERRCEVGQPGELALITDLMGDPVARVRNFVSHVMLVRLISYAFHITCIKFTIKHTISLYLNESSNLF